jgi:alkylation response protein AidB-like acyl-CoA dehydrogenase
MTNTHGALPPAEFPFSHFEDWHQIRLAARKLLQKELTPRIEESEKTGVFAHSVLKTLGQAGLAAPMLPEPWGTGDLMAQTWIAEEMGALSSGFGLSVLASVCLFGANVGRHGTAEQKARYLPGIATGEKIGCWGLTEPATGSDALSIKTRCQRDGDHYILNGSKTFITNAPIADFFIIVTREYGADGKPIEGFQGGTAFILERGTPGLRTGNPFHKLGHWSSPTGEVFLDNCRVPASQVLGTPGGAFSDMKYSLDVERAVFGGLGTGLMRFCLETVVKYGAQRKQFGVPLLEHQMIQEKVAEMSARYELIATYQNAAISKLMRGEGANKEAAILKVMGSRFANEVADEAVQALGGYGYMQEYQVERCLRDAKLYDIGGGTSEIQKLIIAKQTIREILSHGHTG